jgi:hypothetical protein
MSRAFILLVLVAVGALLAFWLLLQTPGTLNDALAHPLAALVGTSQELNAKLLEASESVDSVRAAGRRLLQPFGIVRLVRIYQAPEGDTSDKKH